MHLDQLKHMPAIFSGFFKMKYTPSFAKTPENVARLCCNSDADEGKKFKETLMYVRFIELVFNLQSGQVTILRLTRVF